MSEEFLPPVEEDAIEEDDAQEDVVQGDVILEEPPKNGASNNKNRNIIIACCAAFVLLFCCCFVAAGSVLAFDPFGWDLFSFFGGRGNAAAKAMPADAEVFVGIDVRNADPEQLSKIIEAFAKEIDDSEIKTYDDFIKQLDEEMTRDMGLTFSEDIQPWMGNNIAIGMSNVKFDQYGEPDEFDLVFAIEARDKTAADEFLVKFEREYESTASGTFQQEEYEGVTIYEFNGEYESERLAFARSGKLVLLGTTGNALKNAIDAQNGDSLSDNDQYRDLIKKAPGDPLVSFFLSGEILTELTAAVGSGAGIAPPNMENVGWQNMLFTMSVIDEGLQFDALISFDPDALTESQKQLYDMYDQSSALVQKMPKNTVLFIGGRGLNLVWEAANEQLATTPGAADLQEAMDMLAREIGINLDKDLFPYLDGEYAIGVMPSSEGMLAAEGVNLGYAVMFESSNAEALNETVVTFNEAIESDGFFQLTPAEVAGHTTYVFPDFSSGDPLIAYGVVEDFLILSSSPQTMESLFADGDSLADNEGYKTVSRALPGGADPYFYADVRNMVGSIREGLSGYDLESFNEAANALRPIQYFAGTYQTLSDSMIHSTAIIFIETE